MSETVLVPGGRDVRGTLDDPDADACVVACPPHPQFGGRRTDERLRAVSDALAADAATLRFDYGEWDEGHGELADVRNALSWAAGEYDRVALFGFSFGGCLALLAAEGADGLRAVSAVAPAARVDDELDAVAALPGVTCPGQVLYGERDTTVDWEPVVERARDLGWRVESLPADHHFVGQAGKVGEAVAAFLRPLL